MSQCLDADTAASFVAGALAGEAARAVEHHIDGCEKCRVLVSMVVGSGASTTVAPADRSPPEGPVPAMRPTLPRGTRVGPFELIEPLAAGGMGVVYVADDPRLHRRVALKAVRDARTAPEQMLAEARAMARLTHPNVVQVHDVVEAYGQIFIAMELVVGTSVRSWLEAAPRPWRAIIAAFLEAGQGLVAAHEAGLVHGDVKPANMLLGEDGRVRVTDFGLAGFGEAVPGGVVRGTPGYIAPELYRGVPCDARGDQYAFCVSLHQALFGSPPGTPPVREPAVPRAIRAALARGLSDDPALRFPSMAALLVVLRSALSTRARWAVAAAVLIAGSAAVSFVVGGRRSEAQQCEAAAAELAMPWNAVSRAQLRHGFEASGLSYAPEQLRRVEAALDGWQVAFDGARQRACAVGVFGRPLPPEQLALQLRCLTDRARDVRALLSELRDADATLVNNAVSATRRLASQDLCPPGPKPPPALADSAEVRDLRDKFARIRALREAGRFQAALPLARALPADAQKAGIPTFIAAAQVALGGTLASLGKWDEAVPALREGLYLAELAEDDRLRAQALVTLVQAGYKRGEHAQVVALEKPALGAAQRVGDAWLATEVMLMVGGSLSELGQPERAQALFEEAVRIRERVYGKADRRSAFALSSLGNALAMRGQLEGAIDAHARALATAEADLGATHPNIGVLRTNLGDDYLYGLRAAEAVTQFASAVAVFEAAGPGGRELANTSTDFGFAKLEAGDAEGARATFVQADVLWEKLAPTHPVHAMALLGLHQARVALKQAAPVADLERALSIATGLPPFERGRIQLALGLALPPAEKVRAIALVKQALQGLTGTPLPLVARERQRAQAWLEANGAAP